MTTHFTVIATYTATSDTADEVAMLLPQLAEASRAEEGNISYTVARDLEDPRRFTITERYVDAAAFQAHRDSEHFQRIGVGTIIPLLHDRVVSAYTGTGAL
ncbi:putative quinol monooxygenase [Microbacterium keratanolyticum]|uniref:putative quinol monooxygenase n=1 Tax=Microbacterium keratanolyticum TaxID=67574 RepID=UPI00362C496E